MVSLGFNSYSDLHRWSVQNVEEFWLRMVDVGGIQFTKTADCVLNQPGDITSAVFFGGAELSFPEHILRHAGKRPAIIFRGENGSRRELSFDELGEQVSAIAEGLRAVGVKKGDRVAGFMPNCPETIIAMLAATSLGAIW